MPEPRLITIPSFVDCRGTVSVIEWEQHLPFEPKRFYFVHNVADGARRAGHAHRLDEEVVLAVNGSFTVIADDGVNRREFVLDRPDVGLHLPPLVWHELYGFSAGAICAVLASQRYNKEDYLCDYQQFLEDSRACGR